jgi:DNA-binding CsgD family transcriptional regulator
MRAQAATEALGYFRSAADLLAGRQDDTRRAAALSGLGEAATLAGDYRLAVESYRAAAETAQEAGDAAGAARGWRRLGAVLWRREAVQEAQTALARALEQLTPGAADGAGEGEELVATLLQLADLHAVSLGRQSEGSAYGERALALVARLGDRRLEAAACAAMGAVKTWGSELAAGRALLERALALARERDDPALAAEVCGTLASACCTALDLGRSWEVTALREEFARRSQDPFQLRHVHSWMGFLHTCRGEWAAAERLFDQAEPVVEGLDSPEPRSILRMHRGVLHHHRGRFVEAEAECGAALATIRGLGTGGLIWFLAHQDKALAELGRRDEALAHFGELEAVGDARDERATERGFAFAQAALGYHRLGALDRAAACYPKLRPFQGQFPAVLVDRALGVAAACRGEGAAARRHLVDAEAQARRERRRPELALTLLQRALVERTLGGARADTEAEGLRLCEELGMLALGRRVLAGPGERTRPPERRAWPDGLSGREVEVLRLVALGQTNRAIARALVLSERTVAHHLTSVFTKIGVDNRAGATAYALRHGLA